MVTLCVLVVVREDGMQKFNVMLLAINSCASETEDTLYVAIVFDVRNLANQPGRQGLRRELHLSGHGNMSKNMTVDMLIRR